MRASLIIAKLALDKQMLAAMKTLYNAAGSVTAILENKADIRAICPDASEPLVNIFKGDLSNYERIADEEMNWCEKKNVTIRTIDDEIGPSSSLQGRTGGEASYPTRLRNCFDAPLVLFTRGKADINASHILSIVGTRNCTPYGQDAINKIVRDLAQMRPDIVIVSGLAYGIDIAAHRAALNNNLSTVGVVAHGQGMLYPITHRNEANRMCLGNGGVVTEYFHDFRPFAQSFLQRNRIIAGLSDATMVVESASHGGGLVTARISTDYGRETLAVPGPINSEYSAGTNNLIRDNKASLITCADDILKVLGWQDASSEQAARTKGIERQLFPQLTPDEQRIVDALKQGDQQTNALSMATEINIGPLTSSLFSLEMKGVVKPLSGNVYHLIL